VIDFKVTYLLNIYGLEVIRLLYQMVHSIYKELGTCVSLGADYSYRVSLSKDAPPPRYLN
jgi:hypothetical protein